MLALPLYARDELGVSDIGVGIAVGAGSVGAILASAPAGRIADRHGRRKMLLGGAAAMIAGYLILALGPSLAVLIPLRILTGAGEAAFVVAAISVVADLAPTERRGEAVSMITVSSYLGIMVGPLAADLILGHGSFRVTWLVAAAGVALPALAVLSLHETRPHTGEEAPLGWLPPRGALVPGLLVFLALLGFGGYNAFAALYARDIGFDHPGLAFGLFGAVVVLVRAFGRKLPDRLGGRRTLSLSFVALAVGLGTVALWQSPTGLLAGTAVFALGQALTYPAALLLAMEVTNPAERSAVLGSVGAFVDVALGVGAFVLGAVVEVGGYREAFLVASAVALSGLVFLAALTGTRGRAPEADAAAP